MTRLRKIEGIGDIYTARLHNIGIDDTEELLSKGSLPKDRTKLAELSGISKKMILKWINRADLDRVKGINEEYADLLELSGVDTVPELALRNPEHLWNKLKEINLKKNLVRRLPSLNQVTDWIKQAKVLPRMIRH